MRSSIKKIAGIVPVSVYERLSSHAILNQSFSSVLAVETLEGRHDLWNLAITRHIPETSKITYVEFGVWQGESIRYFALKNKNSESRFIGLDSFEGLPEDWGVMPKGSFNVNGALPQIEDARVHFIKGWFQDSWPAAREVIKREQDYGLVVHYDADLYSSTLFALSQIDSLKKPYYAIFDEFTGDENRALYNYCQSYGAEVQFLAKTLEAKHPRVVLCRIVPKNSA